MATATRAKKPRSLKAPQAARAKPAPAPVGAPVESVPLAKPHPIRWSSEEYHRLSEAGFFEGRRVELVKGEIIQMAAMNGPHWASCKIVERVLEAVFGVGTGYLVVMQLPVKLENGSEPQPDVMVVAGDVDDYAVEIPTTSLLVVEVSVSTLRQDRLQKTSLYAEANIQECWILDVEARQLEVYRRPIPALDQFYGWGYAEKIILREGESASPLVKSEASVAVTNLLPKVP